MELEKSSSRRKKSSNSIFKKLVHSLSFPKGRKSSTNNNISLSKSKSWHSTTTTATTPLPNGCFSVYVGQERQRFIIKTKYVNHPLFKMLLEDAESEYGYNSEGPLLLPCDVNLFYKVLAEMDNKNSNGGGEDPIQVIGCGSSCSPFRSPGRKRMANTNKGYGSYALLTPPRLLKINHFYS